jgi:uncharacterized protein
VTQAGPVALAERVEALDVMRGLALFGVFLMNFTGFAGDAVMATEQQLLSLPTAALDHALDAVLDWLVMDKANTIFAFLFGLGFYLQISRLEARGLDAYTIYRRRLTLLLVIGLAHNFLLWTWDILHLYALAGFFLLAFRGMSDRALVAAGLLLAAFGRTAIKTLLEFTGSKAADAGYSESAVLARQALSEQGDYAGLVRHFFDNTMVNYVFSGLLLGWLAYALGRFFIGAWVGRRGFITDAGRFMREWRLLMRWAVPFGLALEGAAFSLAAGTWTDFAHREFVADCLHLAAVPMLAAGYVATIVIGLQGRARRALGWFAPVGRMALTNYLVQSLAFGFVLFGVGPGLALAGKIGTTAIVGIVMVFFAAQMMVSRWWLGRYAFGPAEWVWRALTYGERPALRGAET